MKIFLLFILCTAPIKAFSKSIYLNGIDVTTVINQDLKRVNVKIDTEGNVLIEAPHYQVISEEEYTPISLPSEPAPPKPESKPISVVTPAAPLEVIKN